MLECIFFSQVHKVQHYQERLYLALILQVDIMSRCSRNGTEQLACTISYSVYWHHIHRNPRVGKTYNYQRRTQLLHHAYKNHQQHLMQRVFQEKAEGKAIELCGDARSDSPGKRIYVSWLSLKCKGTKAWVHCHVTSSWLTQNIVSFYRPQLQVFYIFIPAPIHCWDSSFWIATGRSNNQLKDSVGTYSHGWKCWHPSRLVGFWAKLTHFWRFFDEIIKSGYFQ